MSVPALQLPTSTTELVKQKIATPRVMTLCFCRCLFDLCLCAVSTRKVEIVTNCNCCRADDDDNIDDDDDEHVDDIDRIDPHVELGRGWRGIVVVIVGQTQSASHESQRSISAHWQHAIDVIDGADDIITIVVVVVEWREGPR